MATDITKKLAEALRSTGLFLHHCWCDVQMNEYSFKKLEAQMGLVDAALAAYHAQQATSEQPALSDAATDALMPSAALFTHQLLDHEKKPNGVHLGVASRDVCESAHDEGETTREIWEWFNADQMRAYARAAIAQQPAALVGLTQQQRESIVTRVQRHPFLTVDQVIDEVERLLGLAKPEGKQP